MSPAEGPNTTLDGSFTEGLPHHTIFTFNKEDHTLGNLLTERLHSMPHVVFAAYRVPHPLFPHFELRVGTDGEITPREALKEACQGSVQDLHTLSNEFLKEWALSEARRAAEANDSVVPY